MKKNGIFAIYLFLLSTPLLFPQVKTNIDGFLNIKWGDSFSTVAEKLSNSGYNINKTDETFKDFLYKTSPEIIAAFTESELNKAIQNILTKGEFAGLPVDLYFNFNEGKFFQCQIGFMGRKTEEDYQTILSYLISEYGIPDSITSEGKINAWIFGNSYIVITPFAMQITVIYEAYAISVNR
jgi:hypothetical protein